MPKRILILAGGLAGATGVALSAAAAHAGGGNVAVAATFLLAHAPLLLIAGLLPGRLLSAAGATALLGVALFAGDLLMRHYAGGRLFPMAAPLGGSLMILGWLVAGAAGLRRRPV